MAEYIRRNSIKISRNNQIYILTIIVVFSFICYALKLFSMQILDGRNYRQQSRNISSQVKIIPAQRGEIFDRNANLPLVINTDSFAVDLIPAEIPEGYYAGKGHSGQFRTWRHYRLSCGYAPRRLLQVLNGRAVL